MDELRQQADENIATCLMSYATNVDVVSRQLYGRAVVQVLYQPLNRVLDDIRTVVSTLRMVSEDRDASVRAHLLDQIPEIFIRCRELNCQALGEYLYDRLIEIVLRYLKDGDTQVRRNAYYAMTHLLEKHLLDQEHIEAKVCPAVVELTKLPILIQQLKVDYYTKAIELMGQLAPTIGREKTREFFLDRFIELSMDSVYYVRKTCADFFPAICQVMGTEETAKRLVTIFMQLCVDCEWSVRKSAAESFTKVALMCSLSYRQEYFAPLLFKLLNDSNRWVSFAAFKYLGQFISSFAQPCITGLAYTSQGELFITNAADFNITFQSDIELLNNFQYYTKMFNESMASNKNLPIYAPNASDYVAAVSNVNPYQKFLAPEPFANIGFIPNSTPTPTTTPTTTTVADLTALPPPPPPPLPLPSQQANITSSTPLIFGNVVPAGTISSSTIEDDGSLITTNSLGQPEMNNDSGNVPIVGMDKRIQFQSYYSELSALVNNFNNFNKSNNNEAVIEPTPLNSTLSNVQKTDDDNNTDNDDDQIRTSSSTFSDSAISSLISSSPSTLASTTINNSDSSVSIAIDAGNNNSIITQSSSLPPPPLDPLECIGNDTSAMVHLTKLSEMTSEAPSMVTTTMKTPLADFCGQNLRKNTPQGLPMIIKNAIEIKSSKSPRTKDFRRQPGAMSLIVPKTVDYPPPETPSIELAPQTIDFQLNNCNNNNNNINTGNTKNNSSNNNNNTTSGLLHQGFDNNTNDQRVEEKNLFNSVQTFNCSNVGVIAGDESVVASLNDDNKINKDTISSLDTTLGVVNEKNNTTNTTNTTNTSATTSNAGDENTVEWDSKFSELFNLIKLMNDDDKNENKIEGSGDGGGGGSGGGGDSDIDDFCAVPDDDETLKQYNSANFWYVNPDLPLDLDNFGKNVLSTDNNASYSSLPMSSTSPFKELITLTLQNSKPYGRHTINTNTNSCSSANSNNNNNINSAGLVGGDALNGFKQDIVPPYLVEYFVSMVSLEDLDMIASCAYNFPAVVLTLGRENWHMLHYLLYSLCSDIQWKIRKTVAVSIYPIALIIGSELATKDLVPIYLGFFKDLDVVKVEALRNLDDFLKVVNLSEHHKIIMALGDCLKTDNDANWRFREELAHQVLLLIKTYGLTYTIDCMIYLTGIAFMLLTDKVNSVREIALDAIVAKFVISSSIEVAHLTSMLLNEFATHSHWRRRQIYSSFCHKCITKCSLSEEMIVNLINLAQDKVPNVRLSVAKCLKDILYGNAHTNLTEAQYKLFADNLEQLQQDCDRDVRNVSEYYVTNISPPSILNQTFEKQFSPLSNNELLSMPTNTIAADSDAAVVVPTTEKVENDTSTSTTLPLQSSETSATSTDSTDSSKEIINNFIQANWSLFVQRPDVTNSPPMDEEEW